MKRIFVIFAAIVLIVFSSCGTSYSDDPKSVNETEEVASLPPDSSPTPIPTPVLKDETVSVSAFYLGEYTVKKEKDDEGQGEAGPYTSEHAAFQLAIVVNGITQTISMTTDDYWDHKNGQTDPGKTEELKKLYEKMKTISADRIQVVLGPDTKVKEAFLLPEYKEGKDGAAGTIVSPKIQIYPHLMAQ